MNAGDEGMKVLTRMNSKWFAFSVRGPKELYSTFGHSPTLSHKGAGDLHCSHIWPLTDTTIVNVCVKYITWCQLSATAYFLPISF